VIDACGVASPLRKYRVPGTEIKEWYTGIVAMGGIVQDPETELDPEVVRRLGQGTLMVLGDRYDGNGGMAMFLQRFGAREEDHRASFGFMLTREGMGDLAAELGLPASNRVISETDQKETVEKFKAWIKKELGDRWDPMYRQIIDCLTNVNVRPLFMFPPTILPLTSSPVPLVCVGDALHALPPFTGSGGNLALEDAGDVGTFLVRYALGKDKSELLAGLRAVELKCFQRAAKVVTGMGETMRMSIIRTLKAKGLCGSYSLAIMLQGETGWTHLKRFGYALLRLYMWLHKLSDYGMGPRTKAKSA